MFKKTITFTGFDDKQHTQDFYFHMSKAEFLQMATGGEALMARLQSIVASKDSQAIFHEFREIIKAACGTRSEDGSRFLKTPEAQSALLDSPAFDELLMGLFSNPNEASEFINQLLPKKMQDEMAAQLENVKGATMVELPPEDNRPDWLKEHRNPRQDELMKMSKEEMMLVFQQSGK